MKPETEEWLAKAEADWLTANREHKARRSPNFDDACFHWQQCVEKYLKAIRVKWACTFQESMISMCSLQA